MPAVSGDHLVIKSSSADTAAAEVHQKVFGSNDADALLVRQWASSGDGRALVVQTDNPDAPALTIVSPSGGEAQKLSGTLTIAATPGAAESSALPHGYGNSDEPTGLVISSSYPSDDDVSGTDGTGRLNLYSYQRANVHSFGENIRHFLMRSDAKSMQAYYMPVTTATDKSGYVAATRNPATSGVEWKPVSWTGSHFEANDHGSIHGHWELEIPDVTGALQGRLEVPFIDQEAYSAETVDDVPIGVAVTNIRTNLADLTVRSNLGADGTGYLRIGGGNSVNKELLLSISSDRATSGRRWGVRANTTTEAGANLGTDFELVRYSDAGAELGAGMIIRRSNGQVAFGGSTVTGGSLRVNWATSGQHGFYAVPSSTPGTAAAFATLMTDATDRALDIRVTGDSNARLISLATGQLEWGDGTSRDTNLYRAAANSLKTDDLFTSTGMVSVTAGTVAAATFSSSADGTATQGVLVVNPFSTSKRAVDIRLAADTVSRLRVDMSSGSGSGTLTFGDGTTADVNLYRSAANVLKTDDKLIATVGLGVGNSAAATSLGSVTKKIEVFDASGASLGFLPVYDAIT